jgi:hypothetical protein
VTRYQRTEFDDTMALNAEPVPLLLVDFRKIELRIMRHTLGWPRYILFRIASFRTNPWLVLAALVSAVPWSLIALLVWRYWRK